MILPIILLFAHANTNSYNLTNVESCLSGSAIKLYSISFDNFPVPGNYLKFTLKAEIIQPVFVDTIIVELTGNAFSRQEEFNVCVPPGPYSPLDFSESIQVANYNQESYNMQIYIGNCFEYFSCYQLRFGIWKNL